MGEHIHSYFKILVFGITLTILPLRSSAQDLESKVTEPIKIQRINGPVTLDGMSDEAAWEGIEPLPVVMHVPTFGNEPTEKTEFLIAYDDEYLYVAGRLYDSDPSKIQSTTKQRDTYNLTMDRFGVVIDTFNDNENSLGFVTTPAGLRTDFAISNDAQGTGARSISWNTFWDVASVQNDDGWFAEMRIPFSSLRFQERDERVVMGLIVWRWIPHKNELV
ncbi:carbohydrate binding family 9 domain-containing protein, partial [Candidatus Latescibacterota bacterium]